MFFIDTCRLSPGLLGIGAADDSSDDDDDHNSTSDTGSPKRAMGAAAAGTGREKNGDRVTESELNTAGSFHAGGVTSTGGGGGKPNIPEGLPAGFFDDAEEQEDEEEDIVAASEEKAPPLSEENVGGGAYGGAGTASRGSKVTDVGRRAGAPVAPGSGRLDPARAAELAAEAEAEAEADELRAAAAARAAGAVQIVSPVVGAGQAMPAQENADAEADEGKGAAPNGSALPEGFFDDPEVCLAGGVTFGGDQSCVFYLAYGGRALVVCRL